MTDFPSIVPFGTAPSGETVSLISLSNGILSCQILTYGATLRALFVPDRNNHPTDVVLGYDTLDEYVEHDTYFGATVGRFANRIANGRFILNGKEYALAINNAANHLHGGQVGFSDRVWDIEHIQPDTVTLSLFSPDGEESYPGNLTVKVTYQLTQSTLSIRYQAVCDQDTPCSLTNHSYFNLSGHNSGPVLDQEITIFARTYTPSNGDSIPLGTMDPVEGTPMDLRTPIAIGTQIHESFSQLEQARGYDHNFVVDGPIGTLRNAALAHSSQTGIAMLSRTTMPGVHFYTANYVAEGCPGKGGCYYGPRHGFCLETQHFPDAPNQPAFPCAILKAGQSYDHTTEFTFSAK